MVVVSHPTGNRNVRAVLNSLQHAGLLEAFHSTLALGSDTHWHKVLPHSIRKELERRSYDIPKSRLHTHPMRESLRFLSQKLGTKFLTRHETGYASVDAVYRQLDKAVSKSLSDRTRILYSYEDGALESFKEAKRRGILRVYDLPIAYWETARTLLKEEAERMPDWAATLGGGLSDSEGKLTRKTQELELAEIVITPSLFVAKSLPAWAKDKKQIVAPFGSPASPPSEVSDLVFKQREQRAKNGKALRVLFVGSMGQRKGLGDLMSAVQKLARADVELIVLGSLQEEASFYHAKCPGFIHEPGRPHAEVLKLMQSCDVFCLPSIVEGRALVMQEAMSQGLPVIITPNTGGEDLIGNTGNVATGFLVPIRSPVKIAEAISWCADHRLETIEMGREAQSLAARYTWEAYGDKILACLQGSLLTQG